MQISGTWIQKLENGDEMPFAFYEVGMGLHEMGYKDSGDDYDWVPCSVMRSPYYRRFTKAPILTPQKFGIAVRLAFPPLSDKDCRRVTREHNGRRYRGVKGIIGPGGLRTDDKKY